MEIGDEKEHFPLRGISKDRITDTAEEPDFPLRGPRTSSIADTTSSWGFIGIVNLLLGLLGWEILGFPLFGNYY